MFIDTQKMDATLFPEGVIITLLLIDTRTGEIYNFRSLIKTDLENTIQNNLIE
jgi:hypothetical protein